MKIGVMSAGLGGMEFEKALDYCRSLGLGAIELPVGAYPGKPFFDPEEVLKSKPKQQEIIDRLDFELDTIKKMGYPGYFLITQDFINKAKEMGVLVGPGRGSAAGAAGSHLAIRWVPRRRSGGGHGPRSRSAPRPAFPVTSGGSAAGPEARTPG